MDMESGRRDSASLDRKSSIETEPRTLSFDQMQYAREAALHVVNSKSPEEASSIFTLGMEPAVGRSTQKTYAIYASENVDDELRMLDVERDRNLMGTRDTASAPF